MKTATRGTQADRESRLIGSQLNVSPKALRATLLEAVKGARLDVAKKVLAYLQTAELEVYPVDFSNAKRNSRTPLLEIKKGDILVQNEILRPDSMMEAIKGLRVRVDNITPLICTVKLESSRFGWEEGRRWEIPMEFITSGNFTKEMKRTRQLSITEGDILVRNRNPHPTEAGMNTDKDGRFRIIEIDSSSCKVKLANDHQGFKKGPSKNLPLQFVTSDYFFKLQK